MTAQGTTSNLSIDETLLLHSIGWEPVDLVFGVSWWSIPWNSWWQVGEIKAASLAFGEAFAEASADLRQECHDVGGTGVVGVEMEIHNMGTRATVSLVGTAVRNIHEKKGEVFISDLGARDFLLLDRAGWDPIGLAAGASFVVAPRRSAQDWASTRAQFMELPLLTRALYEAREHAMARLTASAEACHAHGVVQVKLKEGPLGTGMRAVQFVAVGTAIRMRGDTHRGIAPRMVVGLDDTVQLFQASNLRKNIPQGRRGLRG